MLSVSSKTADSESRWTDGVYVIRVLSSCANRTRRSRFTRLSSSLLCFACSFERVVAVIQYLPQSTKHPKSRTINELRLSSRPSPAVLVLVLIDRSRKDSNDKASRISLQVDL
jgi:hypothetical protein